MNINNIIKILVVNLKNCGFIFFIYAGVSYAYNINMVELPGNSYKINGYLNSDEITVIETNPYPGVMIFYYNPAFNSASSYWDQTKKCANNPNEARQTINKIFSDVALSNSSIWANIPSKANSISIRCSIDARHAWKFDNYVGKPINPGAASCQVTPPLEVDFGKVTVGDNNKTIEKQVTIKCDKATRINLTLQGDGKTNLLTMSGTKIKLGVGGDTQTKGYDVKAGEVTMASLIFTLSDTGNTPGVKKGYALLVSELP